MISPTKTAYAYIDFDEKGRAIIAGTRFKLYILISWWQGQNWTPEELHEQFPDLSMAQIHSALAYYWDHQEEVEQEIEDAQRFEDEMRRTMPEPPGIGRLRRLLKEQQAA